MSKKSDDRQNIVIVGGGSGGSILARLLSAKLDVNKFNIILINPLPYKILLPPILPFLLEDQGEREGSAFVPYDKNFYKGHGSVIEGTVVEILKDDKGTPGGEVLLESGDKIPFDVLALATGSTWQEPMNFPPTADGVTQYLAESRKRFQAAKQIVLVGGGSVSIEFAGEIKDVYPDKPLTIVHAGNLLLNDAYPDKYRKKLETSLRARGIDIILNEYVDEGLAEGASSITTRSGRVIPADYVIHCRGPRPNTQFIAKSLGSDTLTPAGRVIAKPTLQLPSHPDIFILGDILNYPEPSTAVTAINHANIAAPNIISYLAVKPSSSSPTKMKEYKGTPNIILITIGRGGGAAYFGFLWGIVLGDWAVRLLKNRVRFVKYLRGMTGY